MALVALAPPGTAVSARALTVAAHVHGTMLGDFRTAIPLAEEALRIWRPLDDAHGLAVALVRRGQIALWSGDAHLATTLLSEARSRFPEPGRPSQARAYITLLLAEAAQAQGDHDRALGLHDEALAEAQERGGRACDRLRPARAGTPAVQAGGARTGRRAAP
jgi:hypothetical protein